MYLLVEKTMQTKLTNCISVTLKFSNLLLVFSSALHFLQRALIYRNKIGLITHARSGMSLNLPAVFLFIIVIIIIIIIIIIIFCVAIVHFRFMALAPLFPRSTQYLFDFRFFRNDVNSNVIKTM